LEIYCDDHSLLSSTTAVQKSFISCILHISCCFVEIVSLLTFAPKMFPCFSFWRRNRVGVGESELLVKWTHRVPSLLC